MTQSLFEVFGTGSLGQKADDLNRYTELLARVGMNIPKGYVIATGIFDQLFADEQQITPTLEGTCPNLLQTINQTLLQRMEVGRHYAIRSSAISEFGGTGIYKSVFFTPKGNIEEDLDHLWRCEAEVYASEFTNDAVLWREKQRAAIGMAILIQPVSGIEIDEWFLPVLSGTAYTSYNGLLTVRWVIGLGTRAVKGDGLILHSAPNHLLSIQKMLWDQELIDLLTQDGLKTEHPKCSEQMQDLIQDSFETFQKLFEQLEQLGDVSTLYLEWAISGQRLDVVQCSEYKDVLPGNHAIDPKDYFHLMTGTDVFNTGTASCNRIICAGFWSERVAHMIEQLNRETQKYLLIVTQDALSELAGNHKLGFRHFSHASAVVEMQWTYTEQQRENLAAIRMFVADHIKGRKGATHFSEICRKTNILFIGGPISVSRLWQLKESMHPRNAAGHTIDDIHIWNIDTVVTTDAARSEGSVYVSKHRKEKEYARHQIMAWCGDLRTAANKMNDRGHPLSDHFYRVHYAIAPGDPAEAPNPFDPFDLDRDVVAMDGMPKTIESTRIVLEQGRCQIPLVIWNNGLKSYLEDLLKRLETT